MKSVGETKHRLFFTAYCALLLVFIVNSKSVTWLVTVRGRRGVGGSRPWVLGTLINEGVKLESCGRFV
jgi:hypothetical protein